MKRKPQIHHFSSPLAGRAQSPCCSVDGRLVTSALLLMSAAASMAQEAQTQQTPQSLMTPGAAQPSMTQEAEQSLMFGGPTQNYQLGQSPLGVAAASAKVKAAAPERYTIALGSGGLNFDAGLKTEYVDNVYLTDSNIKDDFILVPECNLGGYFPVGQANVLSLDVGLAYYQYLKNTSLNTGIPLINPNTDLAFSLYSGDFSFKFSERFSYQQSPLYETGNIFYNLYNTALFQRYENQIGGLMTWDQNKLVVTAGYFHYNLWSENSFYNYIDHTSELFSADAMLAASPRLTIGMEAAGSINSFPNSPTYDTWRATVGPAVRIDASEFIKVRLGAGYERIQYDSGASSNLGLTPDDTFYAYGAVEHRINLHLTHSLSVWHDNQIGFNAANLEGTHLSYSLSWVPRPRLTISPQFLVHFFDESFGSGPANLYHDVFTFYYAGLAAQYQLGPHWRAGASWYYNLKQDSTATLYGFAQNQVSLELLYQF